VAGSTTARAANKTTTAGQWKIIATDVIGGTKFKCQFASSAASSGLRAH
jgi:hypothetical protein